MRKTYAYNSIIIGVLVGLLVGLSTENVVLGVLACVGISIVGFVVIKFIENALGAAIDKGVDAAAKAYEDRKNQNGGRK